MPFITILVMTNSINYGMHIVHLTEYVQTRHIMTQTYSWWVGVNAQKCNINGKQVSQWHTIDTPLYTIIRNEKGNQRDFIFGQTEKRMKWRGHDWYHLNLCLYVLPPNCDLRF